jgi:hypothetical protein
MFWYMHYDAATGLRIISAKAAALITFTGKILAEEIASGAEGKSEGTEPGWLRNNSARDLKLAPSRAHSAS